MRNVKLREESPFGKDKPECFWQIANIWDAPNFPSYLPCEQTPQFHTWAFLNKMAAGLGPI